MLVNFTAEEEKKLAAIRDKYAPERKELTEAYKNLLEDNNGEDKAERLKINLQQQTVIDNMIQEVEAYMHELEAIRFEEIKKGGAAAVIKHATAQAPELLEFMRRNTVAEARYYEGLEEHFLHSIGINEIRNDTVYFRSSYATAYLKQELRLHISFLKDDPESLQQIQKAIQEAVQNAPFVDQEEDTAEIITTDSAIFKTNMPMYHGKAIDAFIKLDNKTIKINPFSDKAELMTPDGELKAVLQGFSNLKSKAGINAHKLLCTSVAEFTQNNNYGGGKVNSMVYIPFEEYARKLNYPIDENETDSPEAAAKEKRRAKEARKNARNSIKKDLDFLYNLSYTWTEKIKGKEEDFISVHPFESVWIKNGYIGLQFGQIMAAYLKSLPVTQYSQGLLSIDARNPNAYNIGFKMTEHFNIDNNQIRGSASRLKVTSLLEVTLLPTYEKLKNETPDDSRHWDRRIKDPFENALDILTGTVIKNWEYVRAKGKPLTDKEAYNITDYETFSNLYIQFELLEAPDHSERLERRAAEKKAKAAKASNKKNRNT